MKRASHELPCPTTQFPSYAQETQKLCTCVRRVGYARLRERERVRGRGDARTMKKQAVPLDIRRVRRRIHGACATRVACKRAKRHKTVEQHTYGRVDGWGTRVRVCPHASGQRRQSPRLNARPSARAGVHADVRTRTCARLLTCCAALSSCAAFVRITAVQASRHGVAGRTYRRAERGVGRACVNFYSRY